MYPVISLPTTEFFNANLKGPRIKLVPYNASRDRERLAEIFGMPAVYQSLGIDGSDKTIKLLLDLKDVRMAAPDAGDWSIFLRRGKEKTLIGEVGLARWDVENLTSTPFVTIASEFQGRAFGREAVSTFLKHCFQECSLITVRDFVLLSNQKSLDLARALGFRMTGQRYVNPDPMRGFVGGWAGILDLTKSDFKPFMIRKPKVPQQGTQDNSK